MTTETDIQTPSVDDVSADSTADSAANSPIREFVETNPDYYERAFAKIGAHSRFAWTFNFAAFLLGPIWFGIRGIWKWGLPFLLIEIFALIQIARGLFGNLGADALSRVEQIEGTLAFRREQLASAIEKKADNVAVFERAIASLEQAIKDLNLEAVAAQATGTSIALGGLVLLVFIKLVQGVLANPVLEKRYFNWLSDLSLIHI